MVKRLGQFVVQSFIGSGHVFYVQLAKLFDLKMIGHKDEIKLFFLQQIGKHSIELIPPPRP